MTERYDVIVLGLGVTGSAAAHSLSGRGQRVLGLERLWPGHNRGSSHGQSRILRKVHTEHPDYVTLAMRAYELWDELEALSGRALRRRTGALLIGRSESPLLRGHLESARRHGLPHRLLDHRDVRQSYALLRVRDDEAAFFDEDASVLMAEDCVRACQESAVRRGAELRFGASADPDSVRASIESGKIAIRVRGSLLCAERLVIALGPWAGRALIGDPLPKLSTERLVMYWFEPSSGYEPFAPDRWPIVMWDRADAPFCVFPYFGEAGVKVISYRGSVGLDPDQDGRLFGDDEEAQAMRRRLSEAVPALDGPLRKASPCWYTNTPDGHFALGALGRPNVLLASACSGRGFKFAPVVGEIVADLATFGETRHPIALFRPDRPAAVAAVDVSSRYSPPRCASRL